MGKKTIFFEPPRCLPFLLDGSQRMTRAAEGRTILTALPTNGNGTLLPKRSQLRRLKWLPNPRVLQWWCQREEPTSGLRLHLTIHPISGRASTSQYPWITWIFLIAARTQTHAWQHTFALLVLWRRLEKSSTYSADAKNLPLFRQRCWGSISYWQSSFL